MSRPYNIKGFGPSDLLTSAIYGQRRMKVEISPELVDPFDQLHTAEYTPIIERSPRPGFSVLRDRTVPAGGTLPVVNGELELDGSTLKKAIYTRKRGRYLPGIIGIAGLRVRLDTPTSGTYEYGYGDEFGNRFGLSWVNGDVSTFVESAGNRYYSQPRSQWLDPLDGTGPSRLDVDLNGLTLRLPFGWYGGLTVRFDVAVPDRVNGDRIVTIDRSDESELANGVTIEEPNLPIFVEADGGIARIGGRQYGVYGRYRPEFRTTATPSVTKASIGTSYEPVVSFKVKDVEGFRGVPIKLAGVSVLASAKTEWALFIDPTLTGATFGAISNVPAGETALEIDTAATALSGGYRVYSDVLAGGQGSNVGGEVVDLPDLNLPSDAIVTLAARNIRGTSSDVDAVLRVLEES